MKHVVYYYNGVEGEEELHEDEEVAKLVKGEVVERASEFWRIIQIHTTIGISEPKPIDIVKVFLAGPV
jgi:hypothetical protein